MKKKPTERKVKKKPYANKGPREKEAVIKNIIIAAVPEAGPDIVKVMEKEAKKIVSSPGGFNEHSAEAMKVARTIKESLIKMEWQSKVDRFEKETVPFIKRAFSRSPEPLEAALEYLKRLKSNSRFVKKELDKGHNIQLSSLTVRDNSSTGVRMDLINLKIRLIEEVLKRRNSYKKDR